MPERSPRYAAGMKGGVWTRPGLNRPTRSLLNLAMLAALRQWDEFSLPSGRAD